MLLIYIIYDIFVILSETFFSGVEGPAVVFLLNFGKLPGAPPSRGLCFSRQGGSRYSFRAPSFPRPLREGWDPSTFVFAARVGYRELHLPRRVILSETFFSGVKDLRLSPVSYQGTPERRVALRAGPRAENARNSSLKSSPRRSRAKNPPGGRGKRE